MEREVKTLLRERELPTAWYNIMPDLPEPPAPPLNPGTKQPIEPAALLRIFPMALIEQEASQQRWIDIPGEILDIYRLWRPTPLHRARRLEEALKTPARIYFKNESVSPPGSHKPNTAVAQAYYNKKEGKRRLSTETGAGQWGSALSFACNEGLRHLLLGQEAEHLRLARLARRQPLLARGRRAHHLRLHTRREAPQHQGDPERQAHMPRTQQPSKHAHLLCSGKGTGTFSQAHNVAQAPKDVNSLTRVPRPATMPGFVVRPSGRILGSPLSRKGTG